MDRADPGDLKHPIPGAHVALKLTSGWEGQEIQARALEMLIS
jgi:hypothetical protein